MLESTAVNLEIRELKEMLRLIFDKFWEVHPNLKPSKFDIPDDIELWMIGHSNNQITDNTRPSILELIKSNESVEKYLTDYNNRKKGKNREAVTVSFSQFYNMIQAINNEDIDYQLKGIHKDIYFKFLNYKGVEDFRLKLNEAMHCTNFKGYYFSKIHKEVLSFDLTLTKASNNSFEVTLKGFHDKLKNKLFIGKADLIGQSWSINLTYNELFVNIIIHVGNFHTNSYEVLTGNNHFIGIISGTNSEGNPFATEFLLLNLNNKDHFEDNLLNIKRYLNLTRNHFTTGIKDPHDTVQFDRLKVENNYVGSFEKIADKKFRIFILTNRSKIISQSKLEIKKDYSCYIKYPESDYNDRKVELTCLLSANENHSNLLFIEAFFGNTLYAFTTVKISSEKDKFLSGAYCITLQDPSRNPIGGIFHMIEDAISDDEIGFYKVDNFQSKYSENWKTINAVNSLIEILSNGKSNNVKSG